MRPRKLRIAGFTCFSEPVDLDFGGLDLFAISGPTGSGKTSLLDAVVYALYGRIPRVGGTGLREFISLGHGRMSATLDFEVGRDHYRITRYARRSGNGGVQLEQLRGEEARPLADGVKHVKREVERLLGLGPDAFLQSVVLPQGEFARFLRSTPGERREILRELLRLGVYERMRKDANSEARRLATVLSERSQRLGEDYADATEEARAAKQAETDGLQSALAPLDQQRKDAAAELGETRRLALLTAEKRIKTARVAELEGQAAEIERLRQEVDRARRLAGVVPLIAALGPVRAAAKRAETEVGQSTERLAAAQALLDRALGSTADVAARSIDLPRWQAQLARLVAAEPLVQQERSARERLGSARAEADAARTAVRTLSDQLDAAKTTLDSAGSALAVAEAELGGIEHDPARHVRLRQAAVEADRLVALSTTLGEARAGLAAAEREGAEALADRATLRQRAAAAGDAAGAARNSVQRAEASLAALRATHTAHGLRRDLAVGESCPVCEQQVDRLPSTEPPDELVNLETDLRGATAALQTAEAEVAQSNRALSAADAIVEGSERRTAESQQALAKAQEAVDSLLASLRARVDGDLDEALGAEDVASAVQRLAERADRARERHTDVFGRAEAARALMSESRQAAEVCQARLTEAQTRLGRASQAVEAGELEAETLQQRVLELGETPEATRAELEQRLKAVQKEAAAAAEGEATARAEQAAAEAQLDARRAALDAAGEQLERAERAADEAVANAGFADRDAVGAATVDETMLAAHTHSIEAWTSERTATRERLEELVAELGGASLDQADVDAAAVAARAAEAAHQAAVTAAATSAAELVALARRVERATRLNEELGDLRESHRLHQALASALKSDRFQEYLLRESFRELVAGASLRLHELSDRYTLALHGDDFYVVDHDNAREHRSADTLSGGETFLASLALALELSEHVQRASGAVRLDSLFIDEGFGTLDPETLDTVATTMEALATGNRMVGIVTHVGSLTERMPARIDVAKTPNGSSVEVVRTG